MLIQQILNGINVVQRLILQNSDQKLYEQQMKHNLKAHKNSRFCEQYNEEIIAKLQMRVI